MNKIEARKYALSKRSALSNYKVNEKPYSILDFLV